jgi:hypothetical protein
VLLRIAPPVHVENDAARAVGRTPVVGEGEPEMRLADAGGAIDDGQRAGQQTTAEHLVELWNAGGGARGHGAGFYTTPAERPFVRNWRS